MNINTSKNSSSKYKQDYLNVLSSNCSTNIIDKPTRVTPTSATVLDHILTNENMHQVIPFVIDYDITDHYPVAALISRNLSTNRSKSVLSRSFATFNRDKFNNDLNAKIDNFMSVVDTLTENNVNDIFNEFYSSLTSTINIHAPLKKVSRKQKRLINKPWITKGLLMSIKKKQKMHKTHCIKGSPIDKICYKTYSNVPTKVKNFAKKLYYHHKLNEYSDNPKKTWDVLRTLLPTKSNSNMPNSLTVNDSSIADPADIAEEFNKYFADIGERLANSIYNIDPNDFLSYLKNPCLSSIYLQPVSPQEICTMINSLKQNKANGHDDILPYFLKIAAPSIALPLSMILNCCLSNGIFPSKLKLAKVIPVFKKGAPDQLNNYRPISLLPSLSKIFERLIYNRLLSFFTSNNTIVPTQYGFRHKRSTIHAILDLITECYDNLDISQPSALLFLDIRKAFDSVSHDKLLKKLDFYGIRGVANSLLKSYLYGRNQYVSLANINSSNKKINYGIPQGSILGPILFLIYINDLPSCLDTTPRFFADDTALLITGKSYQSMENLANLELSRVAKWMMSNNLVVNASKTVALPIYPDNNACNLKPELTLIFDRQILLPSTSAKYLGIILDDHLSFKSHIKSLENKISRSVGVISRLSYYLPCNTLVTLYYTLVHSH